MSNSPFPLISCLVCWWSLLWIVNCSLLNIAEWCQVKNSGSCLINFNILLSPVHGQHFVSTANPLMDWHNLWVKGKLFKCGSCMYIVRLICLSNSYRNSSSLEIPWADEISRMQYLPGMLCSLLRDVAVRGRCLLAVIGSFFNYCPLKACSNQKRIFAM